MPEHGQFPMHLQPSPHDTVLVTCNDHVGLLKLGHTSQPKMLDAVTHDTQLCSAVYNKLFNQVSWTNNSNAYLVQIYISIQHINWIA